MDFNNEEKQMFFPTFDEEDDSDRQIELKDSQNEDSYAEDTKNARASRTKVNISIMPQPAPLKELQLDNQIQIQPPDYDDSGPQTKKAYKPKTKWGLNTNKVGFMQAKIGPSTIETNQDLITIQTNLN